MPVGNWGGYVLAGGQSSRMGQDKALLPYAGRPLVIHAAQTLGQIAESVTITGHPERYASLGYRVIPDRIPGAGPLAGIHAALHDSAYEWNFALSCDMPRVTAEDLTRLQQAAWDVHQNAVIPVSPDGYPQPLCAAYNRRSLSAIETALRSDTRKILAAFPPRDILLLPWDSADPFQNVNTPADWENLKSS